ncbi:uncharacterized protein TRAVEDRAFT_70457 [Trametes versicolor FP-101664 SS1]|uniref:uncharacterized protein n=1 Tax=Trametes versicolor (strain FP-101664) TaxID=717944 RepID=UPI00046223F9|nr:uncharacterized protein TRAVEDRAFT_70457 [Trametes versicolor FP-101664 SS1]EIW62356.1 hypothetical protein TRAVEDRAFT_70457 [Trametes versicolor FP-101664 SS1]
MPLPPRFNIDVLLNIMNFSDASTICQLMLISRELYHHGPKLLIPPILRLEHESALASFILFLSAEASYRLKFLKGLSVSTGALSAPVARLLIDFLVRFGPEIKLDICHISNADAFFESNPALPEAFAALTQIDELELVGADLTTSAVLWNSRATFSRVVLCMAETLHQDRDIEGVDEDDEDDEDEDALDGYEEDRNFICLLGNSEETLSELTVDWCITSCPPGVLYAPQYPRLVTLNLLDNELPQTHHYVRAFPNLATLLVRTDPKYLDRLNVNPDAFDLHRAKNESLLLRYGSWDALKSVSGTLVDLYLLGLSCTMNKIRIFPSAANHIDVAMFHAVVEPAQPAYIHLDIIDVSAFYTGSFRDALTGPSVAALRSVDISLALAMYVTPSQIDFSLALDMLIDHLGSLSLHTLGLHICCTGLQFPLLNGTGLDVKNASSFFARGALWPAEAQLLALDLAALTRRIRAAAPSIRTVVLSIAGHRVRPNAVLVVGEEDARALGEGAVEAIPLRLVGELQTSWTEAAEYMKVVTEATARLMKARGELAKQLEAATAGM